MGGLVGKAGDLVLHRRAIARADALDHAGKHRRAVEPPPDDVVGALVGVGNVAQHLCGMLFRPAQEGKYRPRRVPRLRLQARVVDAAAIQARRRTGLEAADPQGQFAQPCRERLGGWVAGAAALMLVQANVDASGEKSAGGQHHRPRPEAQPHLRDHAAHPPLFDDEVVHRLLEQGQLGLALQRPAHKGPVQRAVGLGAGGPHRRALAGVERAELDAGMVRRVRHEPAHGIDLADQLALADAPDGRVAAHLPQGFQVVGEQQGAATLPGTGQRGLGAGVAAADDDDVEGFRVVHGTNRWVR